MLQRSVLKLKDYQVHSVTTVHEGRINANIATWVMQTALKGKFLTVAVFKTSLTYTLVSQSGILNINLLAEEQKSLVNRLGRKSGHQVAEKLKGIPYELDTRGCPFLTEAIGYIQCQVTDRADSYDHELFVCKVLGQKVLHPKKQVLTHHYLQQIGYIR